MSSDEDYWKKLKRCLGFSKTTMHDVRVIGAVLLCKLYTWIDASYSVHDNLQSHTGGQYQWDMMDMVLYKYSTWQSFNAKIEC